MSNRTRLAVLPLIGLFAAACSDSTSAARNVPVTLSISTLSASQALASVGPISAATTANTLVITKAQVVLDEIELKSSTTTVCSESEADDNHTAEQDDNDCAEMKLDPMIVDLPVDGVTQLDVGALVPAGTYRELEFKIDAVDTGEHASSAAFLTAHPDFRNVAVRVEGTFNGQPFVFISREDARFELEFNPAITVGSGATSNVTVAIDVSAWFKNASGDFVNPSDASNASLISGNIKQSLHAFEDEDHDGRDDHHGSDSGSHS
jgi:hypothetical protein